MHKLVILIAPPENEAIFDDLWPQFIQFSARLPGLQRETTSRVAHLLYGNSPCFLIHELYFDNAEAARMALNSPTGIQAGQTLQRITDGHVTLLLTEHMEDTPANYISRLKSTPSGETEQPPQQDTTP